MNNTELLAAIQALQPDAEQLRLMSIASPQARNQKVGVITGYRLLKQQIAALLAADRSEQQRQDQAGDDYRALMFDAHEKKQAQSCNTTK